MHSHSHDAHVGTHNSSFTFFTIPSMFMCAQPNEMTISVNGKAAGTVSGKEVSQVYN